MIRVRVCELAALGAFPDSQHVVADVMERQEQLLRQITAPVTDEEAGELVKLFGPDDYFGLAWTLLHLIETAPHWPLEDCLSDVTNEWIVRLRDRAARAEQER